MYVIQCDGKTIHGSGMIDVLVAKPVLETGIDENGTLTFSIPVTNPYYEDIVPMKSLIQVFDNHKEIWRGRPLNYERDFENTMPITCEGQLGYLNDSYARPSDEERLDSMSTNETMSEYLQIALDIHNEQVDRSRQMRLGTVTVTFPDIEDYDPEWSITEYQTVKAIIDNVKSRFNGHFRTRVVNEVIYLDYLKEYTQTATQEIIFAQNLLDLKKTFSGDKMKTALIPLGATVGDERVTIEDATANPTKLDYLVDTQAVQKYGFIVGSVTYDEIDDEDELYAKVVEEFSQHTGIKTTMEATALDLSLVDKDIKTFEVGDKVHILSPTHGVDEVLQVSKFSLDMESPDNSKITLGDPVVTLTGRSAS